MNTNNFFIIVQSRLNNNACIIRILIFILGFLSITNLKEFSDNSVSSMPNYQIGAQVIKIAKLGKTQIHLQHLRKNCSVMLESIKLFIINGIIILYMDHSISTYLFLHFTIGKFGITKTQIRYVYSVQFH